MDQQLMHERTNASTAQPGVGPESRGLTIPYDTGDGCSEESFGHDVV
jgi:hypothetical protein